MSWISLVLALLNIASKLLDWLQEQKWIAEGEARAVAKASAEILRKTQYGKDALAEFADKSDADVDAFLRSLEPGQSDSK